MPGLTIGILSWKAPKTLINTLESYKKYGLYDMGEDKIILFQEMGFDDALIATEYGYYAQGIPINIGIAAGYKSLVELATGDLFLFLENDWELIEEPTIIYEAAERLRNNVYDVVRFRHTKEPGEPLWSRQYQGHEMDVPEFLLDSVYWSDNPEQFYPLHREEDFIVTTAPFANWTNNPTMFRTEWLKNEIGPRMGNTDVELDIQAWWKQQSQYVVAQAIPGLFRHERLDR